jgi:transcriptional regulator with XRE-family HTH domain
MARDTGHGSEVGTPRTVGERLRAAREARGLSLAEMAELTKVRRAYLEDIEAMRIEALPSRPYAVGYVRSYAEALELDPDALVSRFRAEMPDPDQSFRAPVGLAFQDQDKRPWLAGAAGAAVLAILLWNVAQRAMTMHDPEPQAVVESPRAGRWRPRPPRRSPSVRPRRRLRSRPRPAPYATPGMAEYFAQGRRARCWLRSTPRPRPPAPRRPPAKTVRAAFNPQGAVYGAAPQRSTVILQARKPGFLIVRSKDGQVHFARQLAAGDAYRAPSMEGLTVEVSNPADFDLFRDGELQGPLAQPQTSLDKLAMAGPPSRG